jgi:hypothetical protein
MWNDIVGHKIVLHKDGYTDFVIRNRNDYYEFLDHVDYYGHEYWEKLPIDIEVIERDMLEYCADHNDLMIIKDIKNDEVYKASLKRISSLMDATPENGEGKALCHLADIIEKYEKVNFPI